MVEPKAVKKEKIACTICGEDMTGCKTEDLMGHVLLNHPFELLQTPSFQKAIAKVMYSAGERMADLFKRLENGRQSENSKV